VNSAISDGHLSLSLSLSFSLLGFVERSYPKPNESDLRHELPLSHNGVTLFFKFIFFRLVIYSHPIGSISITCYIQISHKTLLEIEVAF
jgi:hypothetical protein